MKKYSKHSLKFSYICTPSWKTCYKNVLKTPVLLEMVHKERFFIVIVISWGIYSSVDQQSKFFLWFAQFKNEVSCERLTENICLWKIFKFCSPGRKLLGNFKKFFIGFACRKRDHVFIFIKKLNCISYKHSLFSSSTSYFMIILNVLIWNNIFMYVHTHTKNHLKHLIEKHKW